MAAVYLRAVFGRHVGRIEDIFYANRNAMQRSHWTVSRIARARLRERVIGVDICPCMQFIVIVSYAV